MELKKEAKIELEEAICSNCDRPASQCSCTIPENLQDQREFIKAQLIESADPLNGRQYIGGKYRVMELLGQGGMGSVYKVKHEALDKILAAKVLKKDVLTDIKVLSRFDQEAKSVSNLSHVNLVSVHDYGASDDGLPYLIMDFLEGVSLEDEIKNRGALEESRVLDIFRQLSDGLSYAHGKGVIHRDIKPSNIMLVRDEKGKEIAKIVDFGIAKRQIVDNKVTQTGEIFGTPLYMSPEQCLGKSVDARSDVYSLGCVMYEALTGQVAFAGDNAVQTILKHVNEDAKPIRKVSPEKNLSSGIEAVVAGCLEREVDKRIQSADGLIVNLERVVSGKKPLGASLLPKFRRAHFYRATNIFAYSVVAMLALFLITFRGPIQSTFFPPVWFKEVKEARAESEAGRNERAVFHAKKALELSDFEHLPPVEQMKFYQLFVEIYSRHGAYKEAAEAARQAVKYAKSAGSIKDASTYALSAAQYAAHINGKAALKDYEQAILLRAQQVGEHSPAMMDILVKAGAESFNQEMYNEALQYFKRAEQLIKLNSEIDGKDRYLVYHWLASILHRKGQAVEADVMCKKALPFLNFASARDAERLKVIQARIRVELAAMKKRSGSKL